MLNLDLLQAHFTLRHALLYRIRSDGTIKPVTYVSGGHLIARIGDTVYRAADVAWALIYGSVPIFPIILLSDDPTDLREENLVPVIRKRLRFRSVQTDIGWRHRFTPHLYSKEKKECLAAWCRHPRSSYAPDVVRAIKLERERAREIEQPGYTRPTRK